LPRDSLDDLKGGEPKENAAALHRLLDGEAGAYRDIVLLNASAALVLAGQADGLKDAVRLAADAIDDGRAKATLEQLVQITNA